MRYIQIRPGCVADRIMKRRAAACQHPPTKLYSWGGRDAKGEFFCVACSCGKVLKGGV
jgi:hypothetical protein